jgi:hypothetical protein
MWSRPKGIRRHIVGMFGSLPLEQISSLFGHGAGVCYAWDHTNMVRIGGLP